MVVRTSLPRLGVLTAMTRPPARSRPPGVPASGSSNSRSSPVSPTGAPRGTPRAASSAARSGGAGPIRPAISADSGPMSDSRSDVNDLSDWWSRADLEHDGWAFEEHGRLVAFGWVEVHPEAAGGSGFVHPDLKPGPGVVDFAPVQLIAQGRERDGAIEIVLGTGERVVVPPSVSPEFLRRVSLDVIGDAAGVDGVGRAQQVVWHGSARDCAKP